MAQVSDTTKHAPERPLSPHIWRWRWHITMLVSIGQRVSGFALIAGLLLLTAWLITAAMGPDAYAAFQLAAEHPLGRLVLFGFTYAIWFHIFNGLRYLYWDAGQGFHPATARATGVLALVGALVLSVGVWALAYMIRGGGL
jgi:succinate dehydrogenase / fumarate reductase cytochrome b subunit